MILHRGILQWSIGILAALYQIVCDETVFVKLFHKSDCFMMTLQWLTMTSQWRLAVRALCGIAAGFIWMYTSILLISAFSRLAPSDSLELFELWWIVRNNLSKNHFTQLPTALSAFYQYVWTHTESVLLIVLREILTQFSTTFENLRVKTIGWNFQVKNFRVKSHFRSTVKFCGKIFAA